MEGESRRGRGETRRAGNTSRGRGTSNASSLSRSNARSRSRSRSVDSDRRRRRNNSSSSSSVDGRIISSNHPSDDSDVSSIRRNNSSSSSSVDGRIISSNHPSDDSDVSSIRRRRPLTASSSNPATVTQLNYITSNVVAATDNARTEAVPAVTWERVVRSRERSEEFSWERGEEFTVVSTVIRRRETGEPVVPITIILRSHDRREPGVPMTIIRDAQSVRQADGAAVQQLPRVIISERHINDDNNSMCSICLEEYIVGEEARVMPCGHMYHETHIFRWLERQHTCPQCRFEMPIQG